MSLKQRISDDFIKALKSRDEALVSVLKLLKNSVKNKEIEIKKELDDKEIIKVLFSEIKKRKESIRQFKQGNREDLVDKEQKEVDVLQKYLPEMKSSSEIKEVICAIIKEEKINKSISNFGRVMKLVMKKLGDKAEGSIVSKIVKDQLN